MLNSFRMSTHTLQHSCRDYYSSTATKQQSMLEENRMGDSILGRKFLAFSKNQSQTLILTRSSNTKIHDIFIRFSRFWHWVQFLFFCFFSKMNLTSHPQNSIQYGVNTANIKIKIVAKETARVITITDHILKC